MKKSNKSTRSKLPNRIAWQPSFVGTLTALLFLSFSVLPSLLARPALIQGVVSGLSIGVGYAIGLLISSLLRWFAQKELAQEKKIIAWKALRVLGPILFFVSLFFGLHWQNEVRTLLGMDPIGPIYAVVSILVGFVVFMLVLLAGRAIKRLVTFLNTKLHSRVPARIAVAVSLVAASILLYSILSGVLANGFFRVTDGIFSRRNTTAPEGIVQPQTGLRSGTPDAIIGWDSVGFQGREFVGGGPTKDQIEDFSKQPAKEPIRVYAGVKTADSARERAQKAVEELKRVNAFERKVLVIATATGTGWLDPTVVDTLEFIHNGDTAIVSQQYSYLPSWISFLVDQNRAKETGVALYDAVMEEYLSLPLDERPKLLAYGLSLGSIAGQEAFSSKNDIRRSVDGAMFSGTPSTTELWSRITEARDEGSPEWQPTIDTGRSVRFASNREDIINNQEIWTDSTRILYLQHANDPVVWFNFDLLFNKPDWLREERGRNVSPATRWYPIVTFLQVGLDQAIAASAPLKNGHWYVNTPAYAWGAIVPPDDWSIEKADRLQSFIDNEYKSARIVID